MQYSVTFSRFALVCSLGFLTFHSNGSSPAFGATEADPPAAGISGAILEFLYAQPQESTNKRFTDFQSTAFDGAKAKAHEAVLRMRLRAGDGVAFDPHILGELTWLSESVERSYSAGQLKLQHDFIGFNAGAGVSWLINPSITPYAEATLLFPPFKNEVSLSSSLGKVSYASDHEDDGLKFLGTGLTMGTALGVNIQVHDALQFILHYDFWRMGSGKAGGLHVGVGYVL